MSEQERKIADELLLSARDDLIHERQGEQILVNDPVKNTFTSFGVAEYLVFRHFDGKSSFQDIIDRLKAERDVTLEMAQLQRLASRLHEAQLLLAEGETVTAPTGVQPRGGGVLARLIWIDPGIGINPDQALTRLYFATRRIFFRPAFFVAFFLATALAVTTALVSWPELLHQLRATRPTFWTAVRVYAVLSISLCVHELGHALSTKGFGGKVPRMGTFFYYFMSVFYTDVSASYMFKSKFRRLMVIFAGPMTTMMLLSLSTVVWRLTIPGQPLNEWAFTFMSVNAFAAAVTLTPFIRGDGYYIVCTALDIPSLTEKSRAYFLARLRRLVRRDTELPRASDREALIYLIWAPVQFLVLVAFFFVLATRLVVFTIGTFQLIGFLALIWAAMDRTRWPILRWVPWLFGQVAEALRTLGSDGLRGLAHQLGDAALAAPRAVARRTPKLLLWTVPALAIALIPYPEHAAASFSIVSEAPTSVRSPMGGLIAAYEVTTGEWVEKGQVVARFDAALLRRRLATTEKALDEARAQLRLLERGVRAELLAATEAEVEAARARYRLALAELRRARALLRQDATHRAEVDAKRAHMVAARAELGALRAQRAQLRAGVRPEEIAMARAEVARLRAELAVVRQKLDWSAVRATGSGYVVTRASELAARIGRYLPRGDSVLELYDSRQMVARVEIPERLAESIAPGVELELRSFQDPTREVTAVVSAVAGRVTPGSEPGRGTVTVLSELDAEAVGWPVNAAGVAKLDPGDQSLGEVALGRLARQGWVDFWSWW